MIAPTKGAVLSLLMRLDDAACSAGRAEPCLEATGPSDHFSSHCHPDHSLDFAGSWQGRAVHLHAAPESLGLHFTPAGGEVAADLTATSSGRGHDLVGSLDGQPVELHFAAHGADVADTGKIGDIPFHIQHWIAPPRGVRLEGQLGGAKVLVLITPGADHTEHWQGTVGGEPMDQTVTHLSMGT